MLTQYIHFVYVNVNIKNVMANILKTEKKVTVVSMLAEGSSMAAIARITGIHPDTIMRLCGAYRPSLQANHG